MGENWEVIIVVDARHGVCQEVTFGLPESTGRPVARYIEQRLCCRTVYGLPWFGLSEMIIPFW